MEFPKIDYVQIFRDAWNITWKNKFLWWFGFLITIGGAAGSFNYSLENESFSEVEKEAFRKISDFAATHLSWIVTGAIILFVVFLILLILGLIGKGALLKSAEKVLLGKMSNYKKGFNEGKKYWKKILLLDLLLFLLWLAVIVVTATPIIFLFSQKSFFLGGILSVAAVFMIIPLVFLSIFLKNYGTLYIVLGELRVSSAIERAYELFLGNILASVVFGLFFIPLGIVFTLALIFLILPIVLVFLVPVLGLYFILGKTAAIIAGGTGFFCVLAAVVFLQSVWEVFAGVSWVIFFQKIASPKIEETAFQETEESREEILPEIEPVKTAEIKIKRE